MTCRSTSARRAFLTTSLVMQFTVAAHGQQPVVPPPAPDAPPKKPPMVEKLGSSMFRVGRVTVNTASREVSVSGTVNNVTLLEFVANTRGGFKAYESALTLDTDAVTYNAALMLVGLDKAHARVPTKHFDPSTPEGDPVEIWIDIPPKGSRPTRLVPEQLMFDKRQNREVPKGRWVYTGSTLFPDGRYLADLDGVLIGFVHSPAPIIENAGGPGVARYGDIVLNPALELEPDTPVTLTVKALAASTPEKR